ncbi:hypothetical protein EYF80_039198 [Liparis tanakae]|uniref:Uncharacterized protein n=1 Tax=Liparis tanakae TaxID=230148 RepID=A0A4Z2GD37_9TELE|nr:hypothetical protein EYF80_039198 [Liparis tanakae]
MNSAISFCICFPFSCFWSSTSKPVMQTLLWGSFLSICGVNTVLNSSTPEHSTRLLHAGRKAALKHNKASPSPRDINSIRTGAKGKTDRP